MTVIAIGLDSAEPSVLEQWMNEGFLPNFAKLKHRGGYGRLDNFSMFTAELPWTTFATGVMPEKTGYWTPLKYMPDYDVVTRAAYEYEHYPAFFSLGDAFRVCAFDIPQVRLQKQLNGWQFNAWGGHSPQVESESNAPDVYQALIAKHGRHPGLHRDYAHATEMDSVKQVYDYLIDGIHRRSSANIDLLGREPWDLFLTVYSEPHGGGHNFWQFMPDHPLFNEKMKGREQLPENPMRDIFVEIDKSIGQILDAAPDDAHIIVFSAHGMGPNTMDLPSTFFLPEFMYRYCYRRPGLGNVSRLTPPITKMIWNTWERHVWNTLEQGSSAVKLARRLLPSKYYKKFAEHFEFKNDEYPMSPVQAEKTFSPRPWYQPTLWYSNLWPKMQAYALPSFSEGYIRINLKGRETEGVVTPEDYKSVVANICAELQKLKCSRTGVPMVRDIVLTRDDPLDNNPLLPDADIVIGWQEEYASDSVEHPELGRIGPVPHFRAGSHRHTGFMFATGPGIEASSSIKNGHAMDIGPTILSLLNAPIPAHMNGKPIPLVV